MKDEDPQKEEKEEKMVLVVSEEQFEQNQPSELQVMSEVGL